MTGSIYRPRLRHAAIAAAAVAGLVPAILLGGPERSVADPPETVGKVSSLGGSEKLRVERGDDRRTQELQQGDSLHLGDKVIPGKAVEATLTVKRPRGAGGEDLVTVDPKRGKVEYSVTVEPTSKRSVEITIVDTALAPG
jgi:hypothetical protein